MFSRYSILACVFLATGSCGKRQVANPPRVPFEAPAYWVWHRSSRLTGKELSELHHAGTKRLCWQAVECGWKDGKWDAVRISKSFPRPEGIAVIPVFRIKPDTAFLENPDAAKALGRLFTLWADGATYQELQIDLDCPVRLLDRYGKFLRELGEHVAPAEISITALASWPQHPDFLKLARSVRSMAPMFYDLYADAPGEVRENRFQPLADKRTRELIEAWSACPVPWQAGLPNFERVTLYDKDGKLAGHLRNWSHDRLFFHESLKASPLGEGVTLYQADRDCRLDGTEIPEGSKVIHRLPDAEVLASLQASAERAGAMGVIYFALPGPGMRAAYSAGHLAGHPAPRLEVCFDKSGAIVLSNRGGSDLPPNATTGGWRLEVKAEGMGKFRSGPPGEFARLTVPGNAPPELASNLVLHFSKLESGGSITSAALLTNGHSLRWSLAGTDMEGTVKPKE
ncbi:DUF3142 domain-containing protein [Luteolibacter yonseiensis]